MDIIHEVGDYKEGLWHDGRLVISFLDKGYRLRKVELLQLRDGGLNASPEDYIDRWAFIVEKRG